MEPGVLPVSRTVVWRAFWASMLVRGEYTSIIITISIIIIDYGFLAPGMIPKALPDRVYL